MVLLGFLALAVAALLWAGLGPGAMVLSSLLALMPLAGILLVVRFIDRWEPEPRSLMVLALFWGAAVSVAIALFVDLVIQVATGGSTSEARQVMSVVVQAPIVEEIAKGFGLLVVLWVGRRAYDGPVDGVVYGALVGAGFAFTENVLYFADALHAGGAQAATVTFFLRAVMSPFAHVMFTVVIGYAVGKAVQSGASGGGVWWAWVRGLIVAIALHALWNGSSIFGDFFVLYLSVQVPLFIACVWFVFSLRKAEGRLTHERLSEYAAAGWFSAAEVDMLATSEGRAGALAWAATLPGGRTSQMRQFIAETAQLAAARQRTLTGRDPKSPMDEHLLLERATRTRALLLAP